MKVEISEEERLMALKVISGILAGLLIGWFWFGGY